MFLSSLIEELCSKEENNKEGCTLTFGGQCINWWIYFTNAFNQNFSIKKKYTVSNIVLLQLFRRFPLFSEVHLTPEMYVQLRHLRKQTKDLRLEVRNLRRIAQAQSVTARDTVRETCIKIKVSKTVKYYLI